MNNLECFLHELDNDNKEIIFTGDLNCDLLSDVYQAHTHKLTELLNIHQLEQVITDPTRITCNSETLIDILATNRLDKLSNCGVLHIGILFLDVLRFHFQKITQNWWKPGVLKDIMKISSDEISSVL